MTTKVGGLRCRRFKIPERIKVVQHGVGVRGRELILKKEDGSSSPQD